MNQTVNNDVVELKGVLIFSLQFLYFQKSPDQLCITYNYEGTIEVFSYKWYLSSVMTLVPSQGEEESTPYVHSVIQW